MQPVVRVFFQSVSQIHPPTSVWTTSHWRVVKGPQGQVLSRRHGSTGSVNSRLTFRGDPTLSGEISAKQTQVHSQQVRSALPGYVHEPFLSTKAASAHSAVAGHTARNQGLREFFSLHLICRAHAPFLARTLENSLNAESWLYFLASLLSAASMLVRMEQPKQLQSAGISHNGRLGTGDKKHSPTFQPGAFRV